MRGMKGSYYDGGHRVPLFIRWPGGGIGGGRDVAEMALHVDMLPTFIELCDLDAPPVHFDGTSLASLLRGEADSLPGDRVHFVQHRQSTDPPEKWHNAVLTRRWRLVHGGELYDIRADPGQRQDVAADHPDVVRRLREAHERWWDEVAEGLGEYCPISLGNDHENPTCLSALDVLGDVAWNQCHVAMAKRSTGKWEVDVERPGDYRFSLRRWPEELGLSIGEALAESEAARLAPYESTIRCGTIRPTRALVRLFGEERVFDVPAGAGEASVTIPVRQAGQTQLEAWFVDASGQQQGAYYVYVQRL